METCLWYVALNFLDKSPLGHSSYFREQYPLPLSLTILCHFWLPECELPVLSIVLSQQRSFGTVWGTLDLFVFMLFFCILRAELLLVLILTSFNSFLVH